MSRTSNNLTDSQDDSDILERIHSFIEKIGLSIPRQQLSSPTARTLFSIVGFHFLFFKSLAFPFIEIML